MIANDAEPNHRTTATGDDTANHRPAHRRHSFEENPPINPRRSL